MFNNKDKTLLIWDTPKTLASWAKKAAGSCATVEVVSFSDVTRGHCPIGLKTKGSYGAIVCMGDIYSLPESSRSALVLSIADALKPGAKFHSFTATDFGADVDTKSSLESTDAIKTCLMVSGLVLKDISIPPAEMGTGFCTQI